MISTDPVIEEEVSKCLNDPVRFNQTILARGPYWWRQREVCESVLKTRTTAVPAGNGVGKSFLLAGLALWALVMHPNAKVVIAAPTQEQLRGVVWSELESAWSSAQHDGMPLGGKPKSLFYELGDNWRIEGFGSGSVEAKSGRHAADLYAFIDESSGVSSNVLEAIDSLNPSRRVMFGNPLRPEGKFYEMCEQSADNPHVNVIRISSFESPHIHLERSPVGMADRPWLEESRFIYGEDSLWWLSHVLAQFPGATDDTLLPRDWLNLAELTLHIRGGPVRISIDLAKGTGGDESVICVRDDNGVLELVYSRNWKLEETAARAALFAQKYDVDPQHISYDATNLGTDFANRLAAVGIRGAKAFMGSESGGARYHNLRAAAAWAARRRLDPTHNRKALAPPVPAKAKKSGGIWPSMQAEAVIQALVVPQHPFAIPKPIMQALRPELQAVRYELDGSGRIQLEVKDKLMERLKRSPDRSDAFFQSFAFPLAA